MSQNVYINAYINYKHVYWFDHEDQKDGVINSHFLLGFFLTLITVTKTGKERFKDDIIECDFIFSKMKKMEISLHTVLRHLYIA